MRCRVGIVTGMVAVSHFFSGCSSAPNPADWALESKSSMERAVASYLKGHSRVADAELARARAQIASTGRTDLAGRAELLICASRVASLVFEPCVDFEPFSQDAAPTERAYADYLQGKLRPADAALLPQTQQSAARGAPVMAETIEPLSRLVAAGVAMQTGRASPAVVQAAVDTASSQGWRRPVLAWLGVQLALAEKSGDAEEAGRVRRRIALASVKAER